jgi:hypothetical protein
MVIGEAADACRACGACCAYSAEWPRFSLETDAQLDRIPRAFVDDERGRMRCESNRCAALVGKVGVATSCAVYSARPEVLQSLLARRRHLPNSPASLQSVNDPPARWMRTRADTLPRASVHLPKSRRAKRLPAGQLLAILLQKSEVAGRRILRENTKREAVADSDSLSRLTEVACEFGVSR